MKTLKYISIIFIITLLLSLTGCKRKHTITFMNDDGTIIYEIKVKKGDKIPKPSTPTKEEHVFIGWYIEDEKWNFISYVVTEDITLTAQWQINQYTITFDSDGGTNINSIIQDYNTKVDLPTPTKEGYNFLGWYDENGELIENSLYIIKNIKITAKWQKYTEGLEYELNEDGESLSVIGVGTAEKSKNIIIPKYYNNLSVTSIGYNTFDGCTNLESITIPDSLTSIGSFAFKNCTSLTSIKIPNSVTNIGEGAFKNCTSLQNIEISNSVTSIGASAFSDCTSLTSIKIPNNVTIIEYSTFSNCTNLESIIIPDRLTSIGSFAFDNCTSLTNIEIPNSVTSIGSYAFEDCTSLTSIYIPNSVTNIGNRAFISCTSLEYIIVDRDNKVYDSRESCNGIIETKSNTLIVGCKNTIIPNSVTNIGDFAFRYCESLTSIEIPNGITSIVYGAFAGCTSLISVEIGDSVTSIGDSAFYECTSLTSIEIPNSVTSIGDSAFYECTSLISVEIGDSVTSIGSSAFKNCTSLESLTIPFVGNTLDGTTNTHFGYIFGATLYSDNDEYVPTSLKEVIITGGLSIDSSAFFNCTSLISVEIGDSVTSIGSSAFAYCTSLENIEIPNSVTSIRSSILKNCTSLKYNIYDNAKYLGNKENPYLLLVSAINPKITKCKINKNAKSIGERAFYECTSLESIEIPDSVTSIGSSAFSSCINLESIKIPNSVTNIETWTFNGCTSLESIEIPNSVTSIGSSAFSNCTNLISIEIPNSVTSIGSSAFKNCTSLTSIEIPNSITSIGSSVFDGCTSLKYNIYDNAKYLGNKENPYLVLISAKYKYITKCAINDSAKVIGAKAFDGCTSLTSIEIPNGVTSIGNGAFAGCTSLISVEIPDSVTSIGSSAFENCTRLKNIEIPNSVTSIGNGAFYKCTRLIIYCEASSKPDSWNSEWNLSQCPVIWGYKIN